MNTQRQQTGGYQGLLGKGEGEVTANKFEAFFPGDDIVLELNSDDDHTIL